MIAPIEEQDNALQNDRHDVSFFRHVVSDSIGQEPNMLRRVIGTHPAAALAIAAIAGITTAWVLKRQGR